MNKAEKNDQLLGILIYSLLKPKTGGIKGKIFQDFKGGLVEAIEDFIETAYQKKLIDLEAIIKRNK